MSGKVDYSGARVLITGGLGFIGSNLARRLVALGAHLTLVDALMPECGGNPFNIHDFRDRVQVVVADVRDQRVMDSLIRGQDFLFNLAGQVSHIDSMNHPLDDLDINCRAQLTLLESCRRWNRDVKIVFAGSRQPYGRPQYLPVDENHPLNPVDVNGINKMAGERYHLLYNDVYGIRSASLRLTNTYGPGLLMRHNRQGFIAWFIRLVTEGKTIEIFGDGRQRRDLNFVDDVVEAFLLAGASDEANGKVFNLAHPEPISLIDLAQLLIQLAGRGNLRIVPFPEEKKRIDIGDYYGSSVRIESTLGWKPAVSLREGMTRTLAYYQQYLPRYLEPLS